jgi:hypothetical protein
MTLAAAGSATDAAAQGWFTGASVGATKQYDYSVGDDPEASPDVSNSDDGGTGYRVYGGYLFHPCFGVVGSYVDLGSASYSGPAWNGFTDKLDANGFDLSFLAGWAPGQQERFTLFALAGVFFFKQNVHYVENVDDVPAAYDYEDSGMSFSYGVGGELAIGSGAKWGINFEYQRFMDVGDANESGHEYDRDLISAGVHYRFGK